MDFIDEHVQLNQQMVWSNPPHNWSRPSPQRSILTHNPQETARVPTEQEQEAAQPTEESQEEGAKDPSDDEDKSSR